MIKIVFERDRNRSAAYDGETNVGQCTFYEEDNVWVIDHTEVNENYGGQGIAGKLVANVIENARLESVIIRPLCTYAKSLFERKPEYSDVWAK